MPYARRNAQGQLDSLHRDAGPEAAEFLDDRHPEVLAFIGQEPASSGFGDLDAAFVRVIEDVIDTLIVKNVINISDLPAQAQGKLFARKSFRERVSKSSLNLFGQATDFGDIV